MALNLSERIALLHHVRDDLTRALDQLGACGYDWMTPHLMVVYQQVVDEVHRWETVRNEQN